jgi:hypothetical protein
MNPDYGVWYGIAFDTVLFGGMFLLLRAFERWRQRKWRRDHPVEVGSSARLLARIRRLVRPTWLLVPAKAQGFSKLGGDPQLPAGVAWPGGVLGPRLFLAQIDLAAFRPHGGPDWLPEAGRLYAFYDPERHGFADVVSIQYSKDPPGPPVRPPEGGRSPFPERHVAFMAFRSAPSPEWLGFDWSILDIDPEALNARISSLADAPPADEIQHRVGGYPDEIQEERMPLSCEYLARGLPAPDAGLEPAPAVLRASKEWRLLLQIDSDPALGMNFGDGGRLYVFIRERHARAADFSKTVALSQSY